RLPPVEIGFTGNRLSQGSHNHEPDGTKEDADVKTDANARHEWATGWPLAVACLAGMTIGSVMMYALGAFIAPIEQEFGWSRAEISLELTVTTLAGGVLALFARAMLDRWGPRRIALPGALAALGTIAMLSLETD